MLKLGSTFVHKPIQAFFCKTSWVLPKCSLLMSQIFGTVIQSFCIEAVAVCPLARSRARERNRRVGFSTADLISTSTTSECLLRIRWSSRLILLYSNHLEGRQTPENHLVHTGTIHVRSNDVTISILVYFFCGFYFRGSRSVRENRENLHLVKISRYTVYVSRWSIDKTTNQPTDVCLLIIKLKAQKFWYCLIHHTYNYLCFFNLLLMIQQHFGRV